MDLLPAWSRNGKWIYFVSNRNGDHKYFKMPAEGGPAQVVTAGGGRAMESPDGKWFYFCRDANQSLWRIPVEGGEEEQILDATHMGFLDVVEDGVYFIPPSTPEAGFLLQFLRLATGAVEPIHDFEEQPLGGLSVSPDGRSILFGQMEPLQADIMLVENFR